MHLFMLLILYYEVLKHTYTPNLIFFTPRGMVEHQCGRRDRAGIGWGWGVHRVGRHHDQWPTGCSIQLLHRWYIHYIHYTTYITLHLHTHTTYITLHTYTLHILHYIHTYILTYTTNIHTSTYTRLHTHYIYIHTYTYTVYMHTAHISHYIHTLHTHTHYIHIEAARDNWALIISFSTTCN